MRIEVTHIDYSELEGGLARMLDRFKESGTFTGELEADDYLRRSPNGALLGLLYDQRVRAEYAFTGPIRLHERLGHLDMHQIAAMEPEVLREHFAVQPCVHRFTNKMADTTHEIARILVDQYQGDAANLWNDGASFSEIQKRVMKLPGIGKDKARKFKYVLHYFGFRDFTGDAG